MTKLSICIPVDAPSADLAKLAARLLDNAAAQIEIVVAGTPSVHAPLLALAAGDARLRLVPVADTASTRVLWHSALVAATGDWISLIGPGDAIEPELASMVDYLDREYPQIDALAWNVFQIDPSVEPARAASVAIPAKYAINSFDKTAMLRSFFHWERSLNAPKMPFGLHHGAVRRSLLSAMLDVPVVDTWATPVPKYEWAAKTVLFANDLAFCPRPLSAVSAPRYRAPAAWQSATPFSFHAGLGLTGAIAEVQFSVLSELGTAWSGTIDFVRACMIDCMMEPTRPDYVAKGNGYFTALQQFENGSLAAHFQPEFNEASLPDRRRGLHDGALLVERFIGGARTPPEFYHVVQSIMAPVGLICGGAETRGTQQ